MKKPNKLKEDRLEDASHRPKVARHVTNDGSIRVKSERAVGRYALFITIIFVSGCAGSQAKTFLDKYRQSAGKSASQDTMREIKLLAAIEREHAVNLVKEMLPDRNAPVRRIACLAAARLKEPELIPCVIPRLSDDNFYVSSQAAYALTRIGEKSVRPVMAECERLLAKEKRSEAEDWALFHSFSIFRQLKAKEAVPMCMGALSDKSTKARYTALGALGDINSREALPQILAILRNTAEPTILRFRVCQIVEDWRVAEAAEDLIAALKDEAEDVRCGAAMAFKKIKSPKAIPALIDAITDKSQKVSADAIRALYFQTGEKVTSDWFRKESEWKSAQDKWRSWWEQNKDQFK